MHEYSDITLEVWSGFKRQNAAFHQSTQFQLEYLFDHWALILCKAVLAGSILWTSVGIWCSQFTCRSVVESGCRMTMGFPWRHPLSLSSQHVASLPLTHLWGHQPTAIFKPVWRQPKWHLLLEPGCTDCGWRHIEKPDRPTWIMRSDAKVVRQFLPLKTDCSTLSQSSCSQHYVMMIYFLLGRTPTPTPSCRPCSRDWLVSLCLSELCCLPIAHAQDVELEVISYTTRVLRHCWCQST